MVFWCCQARFVSGLYLKVLDWSIGWLISHKFREQFCSFKTMALGRSQTSVDLEICQFTWWFLPRKIMISTKTHFAHDFWVGCISIMATKKVRYLNMWLINWSCHRPCTYTHIKLVGKLLTLILGLLKAALSPFRCNPSWLILMSLLWTVVAFLLRNLTSLTRKLYTIHATALTSCLKISIDMSFIPVWCHPQESPF